VSFGPHQPPDHLRVERHASAGDANESVHVLSDIRDPILK
jgi:hypothetical protein